LIGTLDIIYKIVDVLKKYYIYLIKVISKKISIKFIFLKNNLV